MTNGGYDSGYAACSCFWGDSLGSFVKRLTHIVPSISGLTVLDAGCGEGNNSRYLAGLGATVAAVDCSRIALEHARTIESPKSIQWINADVRDLRWRDDSFDIVVAYGLLHCFKSAAEIAEFVSTMQRATRPNGFHVICSFNSRSQDLSGHPGFEPCLLPHHYFLDLYRDWEICCASDENLTERHPNNLIEHTHSLTRLIAKRGK